MKISKVALCVPSRVDSQSWKRISDDEMKEMESVPDARLKKFRTVMLRKAQETQGAGFMKLDARVRAELGFTHKDAMTALKRLVKTSKANSVLFFCSLETATDFVYVPILRIKKTVFELGDVIEETFVSSIKYGEMLSFDDDGNQLIFFAKLQDCEEREKAYLRIAYARAKEIQKHTL